MICNEIFECSIRNFFIKMNFCPALFCESLMRIGISMAKIPKPPFQYYKNTHSHSACRLQSSAGRGGRNLWSLQMQKSKMQIRCGTVSPFQHTERANRIFDNFHADENFVIQYSEKVFHLYLKELHTICSKNISGEGFDV